MIVTGKEVKRIVSNYFKEKYGIDVDPNRMGWVFNDPLDPKTPKSYHTGLVIIGGICDEEGDSDSN